MLRTTCVIMLLVACLCIPALAQWDTGSGTRVSAGMMWGDASGPLLNLSVKLSSQETFNLMGSAGVGFDSDVTLIPVMLSIEPQPRTSTNWFFGAGLGVLFASQGGWANGAFAYQGYAGYNFSPKMFGELKLIGAEDVAVFAISIGQKF